MKGRKERRMDGRDRLPMGEGRGQETHTESNCEYGSFFLFVLITLAKEGAPCLPFYIFISLMDTSNIDTQTSWGPVCVMSLALHCMALMSRRVFLKKKKKKKNKDK
jgi:hypothetical protein